MHTSHALATFSLVATLGISQSTTVVPATAATNDAASAMLAPGSTNDARRQILVDASLLPGSMTITGIELRRDASYDVAAYAGGSVDLTVTLSHAPRAAVDAKQAFDANHDATPAARVEVFDGRVALPTSPSPIGRAVDWSTPTDRVSIVFTTPFSYVGGTLCIDIASRQVPGAESPFWALDAVTDPATGVVTRVGASCNPVGAFTVGGVRTSADVNPLELVPGCTATFIGRGHAGMLGGFLLGFVPLDLDLEAVGLAPAGCSLRVASVAAITSQFAADPPLTGGVVRIRIQMPTDPGMLGVAFVTQFVELGIPIFTSEGLHCQLAASVPQLGMATVYAKTVGASLPTSGVVWSGRAPVLRIVHE